MQAGAVDAQQIVLRCALRMPVATAAKVQALCVDFRSEAALAEILGVSRSRVTRWLKAAGIEPLNPEKVDLLVRALSLDDAAVLEAADYLGLSVF
jgi:hypothetical protein